ncbi:hypothetical protein BDZ89DRAFT_770227 [Hymenopellis radicata]|nr:hypothetical protein BDZ89DRAFT_770227 [Hymenopellis radicata]
MDSQLIFSGKPALRPRWTLRFRHRVARDVLAHAICLPETSALGLLWPRCEATKQCFLIGWLVEKPQECLNTVSQAARNPHRRIQRKRWNIVGQKLRPNQHHEGVDSSQSESSSVSNGTGSTLKASTVDRLQRIHTFRDGALTRRVMFCP